MTETTTKPTRVIIVDGHPVFAEALAIAIEGTGELTCVGTADDIDAATGLAEAYQPDVAVLDIQLSGSEGVRLLLERHPRMRVRGLLAATQSSRLRRAPISRTSCCSGPSPRCGRGRYRSAA